jgi:hypothetical protein
VSVRAAVVGRGHLGGPVVRLQRHQVLPVVIVPIMRNAVSHDGGRMGSHHGQS